MFIILFTSLLSWAKPTYENVLPRVHDFSITPVGSTVWVEVSPGGAMPRTAEIEVFTEAGVNLFFAKTPTSSPPTTEEMTIFPVGIDRQWKTIPEGFFIWIKAVEQPATQGKIYFNFWKAPVISSQ